MAAAYQSGKTGARKAHHDEGLALARTGQVVGVPAGAVVAAQGGALLLALYALELPPPPYSLRQAGQVLVWWFPRHEHLHMYGQDQGHH